MANAIRFLSIDAVNAANSGHPGMPMGMADIATVLFTKFMHFDPQAPAWLGRDRFVLSNGHGSMLLYSVLHLSGYNLPLQELKNFRQLGSKTPGHPEYGHTPGVEVTTGPLGQGVATAVGLALAQEMMAARYGTTLFGNKTYVAVGDGCLMEGISHEACDLAGHLKLKNLVLLFDDNGISIDGKTSLATSVDMAKRFEAYGFATTTCDGHDHTDIERALTWANKQDKPSFIACKTHIGYGSTKVVDSAKAHGSPLGTDEADAVRKALNWPHAPFEIPQNIYDAWATAADKGRAKHADWQKAWNKLDKATQAAITAAQSDVLSADVLGALKPLKDKAVADKPALATRQCSGNVLDVLSPLLPHLVLGSADLTGSVNTKAKGLENLSPDDFGQRYICYGVREHAMGAVMNGLTLYGTFRAAGGTFLTFADYMRPAIRLAALMEIGTVFVLTHDSIGLGEDGPTHQAVEHLAMLRATPNVLTFRPCDQIETAECWELALKATKTPSCMVLSRQGMATQRSDTAENKSAKGAYILADCDGTPEGIFMATGSEVGIAMDAHKALSTQGIKTRVVSMPCMELFAKQSKAYRDSVLPPSVTARVAIEAATPFGWHRWLGIDGVMMGMEGFGASAPAKDLYTHFGLTADAATKTMTNLVKKG
ncbi:MAG: transketolase [Proteobacteria bacterium]|nr:transketolase [Pseudomonadota bacterium]